MEISEKQLQNPPHLLLPTALYKFKKSSNPALCFNKILHISSSICLKWLFFIYHCNTVLNHHHNFISKIKTNLENGVFLSLLFLETLETCRPTFLIGVCSSICSSTVGLMALVLKVEGGSSLQAVGMAIIRFCPLPLLVVRFTTAAKPPLDCSTPFNLTIGCKGLSVNGLGSEALEPHFTEMLITMVSLQLGS